MNSWRSRWYMWLLLSGVMFVHGQVTASLPNTPAAMLVFHGSAALCDWFLLGVTTAVLTGRLCDDVQWMCLASIAGNFGGWILYMGYASPSFYNVYMWGLTVAQWLRLLIPDRHADYSWVDMVRHRAHFGGGKHS